MRTATLIVRLLLGLIFTVFGANGFFHFIPNMAMPQPAMSFFGALFATGYMVPLIFATQLVAGILLLIGIAVPFALTLIAPVIVNIFLFHVVLDPGGIPQAIVVALLELFLVWRHWSAFAPLFRAV